MATPAGDKPQSLLTPDWKPVGDREGASHPRMGHRGVSTPVAQGSLHRSSSFRNLPKEVEQDSTKPPSLSRRGSFRLSRKAPKEASPELARVQPPTLLDSHEYVMLCHMLCGRLTEDKLDDIPTEALERFTRQALLDLDYMRHQVLKALKHLKKIDPEYRAIAAEKLEGQLKAYEWLEEPFKECLELFEQGKYRKINYSIAKKMGEEAEPFELSVTAYDKRIALIEHWHMLLRFMEEWRITMPSIAELVDKKFTNLKVSMPNLRTYGRKGALSNQAKLEQLTLDITQMQDNWQVISSLASMKAMPNFWPTNPYDQHSVCLPHETKPLPSCHDLKSFLPRGEDAVAARKESAWLPVAPERKEESTRTFCFATKKGAEIRSKGLQMREQSLWKHKLGADLQNPVVYMEIINPRPDQYFSFQPVATHAYSTNCTGALKELNTLSDRSIALSSRRWMAHK